MATALPDNETFVYANWQGIATPILMGVLKATAARGNLIFSFSYDKEWLAAKMPFYLDPNLQLFTGQQYPAADLPNFGIFLDSSPDRWGRLLMRRKEAAMARMEERKEKNLTELDYLLGVFDEHRMGAIRFKKSCEGEFLNADKNMASPPWTSLRALENASIQLEKDDANNDPQYMKWLNMLMAPGSSLGGARPKAGVVDTKGHLWIAKFPGGNDEHNIGGWEKVVHTIAGLAGVEMTIAEAKTFNSKHHTFLSKRFDRTDNGERIHFASAMTLLGYNDGAGHNDGVSYLEMAEFISRHGARPQNDLQQLWHRIVFYICVSNTDDHLRNHGFLLSQKGWVLSPAYDINPVPFGNGLSLNISENDNSLNLDLARSVAPFFRVKEHKAESIIAETLSAVSHWKDIAKSVKIKGEEQEWMSKAFLTK